MCRQKVCHVVTLPRFKMGFVTYRTVCKPSSFLNLQTTWRQWEAPTSRLSWYLTALPAFCVLLLLDDLHFVLCSTPTWKRPAQKNNNSDLLAPVHPWTSLGGKHRYGPTPMGHGIDWDWVVSVELMLLSWMWVFMCVLLFLFTSMYV